MTPERWRQIEALYHSARECGRSVLEGTDPELRMEVERLLVNDSAENFLDQGMEDLLTETVITEFAAAPKDLTGKTIAQYRILEKLGAGGMGVVYKAQDTRLGRYVALKFLPPGAGRNDELKRQLTEEARAASILDHPNIVVVHEIHEAAEGDLFIAMAFHDGVTLREKMATPLPLKEVLHVARQIAAGLERAHQTGIVHRDIKPSNIIVDKDGIARIIDFGLAKTGEMTRTAEACAKGTPLYMSPEQASGKPVDKRTDLWSLGAVLYEMLAGTPPFPGNSYLPVMRAVIQDAPPSLREIRPDLPDDLVAIVSRALEKDPAQRYQSAAEMERDISAEIASLEGGLRRTPWSTGYVAAAICLVVLLGGTGFWSYRRSAQRLWVREKAIPQIAQLAETEPVSAYLLLTKAEQILPGDAPLSGAAKSLTLWSSVDSDPEGATVSIQDYRSAGGPWLTLGTTPLRRVRRPRGYFRWKLTKPGLTPFLSAPMTNGDVHLNFPKPDIPPGMVRVPAGHFAEYIDFIGVLNFRFPVFDIDQFEVTNQQYQQFVDQGGYQKQLYWKEKFVKDGKELSWQEAMDLFRDTTGRSGPSTWEGGHFPTGRAQYPVSGVSWYEAAAYSEFAGKRLPVIGQWYEAAPEDLVSYTISQSNFNGRGPVPVGSTGDVGPFGTYDMSGNIKEWCLNQADQYRLILGGSWRSPTYLASDPEALPPTDRSELNGFRCVRNSAPLPPASEASFVAKYRDFSKLKPVSDAEFQDIRKLYSYDGQSPIDPQGEVTLEDTPDWVRKKLTISAGYENARLTVYLFLPKNVHPPFQSAVFFPSARVNDMPRTDALGDMRLIDYVIKSGRALIYPIYTGTYEGAGYGHRPSNLGYLERMVLDAKEVRRSVDYLETRSDIDKSKIAYLGVSQGSAEGVIFVALEDRFKTAVFLDGGFFLGTSIPTFDQVNFVSRVRVPVLMVNGRYDFTFSPDRAQNPMFNMLGTPATDKRHVIFETPHDVSQKPQELSSEVIGWLDKYLGRVN